MARHPSPPPQKVALVTGASSGIGRATALVLARTGIGVVVGARRSARLDTLVCEIQDQGGQAVALAGDVCDPAYAQGLVTLAQTRFGGLDMAFNNAGILGAMGPTAGISLGDWEQTLRTNLTACFLACQAQIPAMRARGRGSIVLTSTFVGYRIGIPQMAAYAASKAGLGLTRTLAAEYGPERIRVNALLPGGTDTAMGRQFADTLQAREHVAGLHALRRLATPEEIAHSAFYLLSEASSFTTGSALVADGGISSVRG